MRLTKKELISAINQPMCFGSRLVGKKMFAQIINELCEYKDIEEDFGIDLITLFKAIQNGIYRIKVLANFHKKIVFCEQIKIQISNGFIEVYDEDYHNYISMPIKNYRKTWALTKEELL